MLKKLRDRISFLQARYYNVVMALHNAFWAIWGSIMIGVMVLFCMFLALVAVILCAEGVYAIFDALMA